MFVTLPRRLGLRRLTFGRAFAPALGHELIELGLVARLATPLLDFGKLLLLFFKAAQRLGAVFIESVIASGVLMAEASLPAAQKIRGLSETSRKDLTGRRRF